MGQAQDYRRNSLDFWNGIHKEYERGSIKTDDWLVRFDDILENVSKPVLTPGGHLFFRVNSVNDVNHGAGQGIELEHHVYESEEKMMKRFFDEDDIRYFFKDFEILYLHEEVMKRYNLEKRLFRGCVRKPWNR